MDCIDSINAVFSEGDDGMCICLTKGLSSLTFPINLNFFKSVFLLVFEFFFTAEGLAFSRDLFAELALKSLEELLSSTVGYKYGYYEG